MLRSRDSIAPERIEEQPEQTRFELLAFILMLAACGVVLQRAVGLPHAPTALPSWGEILRTLHGSELPMPAVISGLGIVGWALWLWLVGTLLLRLLLAVADVLTRGARWVGALHALSDRVTLPMVRRLADGAIIAATVVQLAARTVPMAGAAPLPSHASAVLAEDSRPVPADHASAAQLAPRNTVHEVKDRDTLYLLAERYYGDGEAWPRIFRANVGRPMVDGRTFPRTGVIERGWLLVIPNPVAPPQAPSTEAPGAARVQGPWLVYTVQQDEYLREIAQKFYGDEMQWRRIYDANPHAHMPDGRALGKPDLVWPGLQLVIPGVPAPAVAPVAAVAKPAPPPVLAPLRPPSHPRHGGAPVDPSAESVPIPRASATSSTSVTASATSSASTAATTTMTGAAPRPAASPSLVRPASRPQSLSSAPRAAAGMLGLAALGLAGAAAVAGRRGPRRRVEEPATREEAGFADSELPRALFYRLRGAEVEPVLPVARQVLRALEAVGLATVSLIGAAQGKRAMALTLSADLADRARLPELTGMLGTAVGGIVQASSTPDQDVLLRVAGSPTGLAPAAGDDASLALLPIGMTARAETLYLNWRAAGHVLVAGVPGGGTDIVLTTLVGGLAATCAPASTSLFTIAAPHGLPEPLLALPHQTEGRIDPVDREAVTELLGTLGEALERRVRGEEAETPEIVLLIGDLAALGDRQALLGRLARDGAAHGIRLLVGAPRVEDLDDALLEEFPTRLVLRTLDDEQSIRLLGRPAAASLGVGGAMLARIAGRAPVGVRGFRIAPESLRELVELLQEREETAAAADAGASSEGWLVGEPGVGAGTVGKAGSTERAAPASATSSGEHVMSVPDGRAASGTAGGEDPASTTGATDGAPAAASPRIEVRCFGEFRVRFGDRVLTPRDRAGMARNKEWEALAYLAAHSPGHVTKERICAALWPGDAPERTAGKLSTTLHRLRNLLGEQVPELPMAGTVGTFRPGICRLDPAVVWSDVQEFLALCQQAKERRGAEALRACERAQSLYAGHLLSIPGLAYGWVDDVEDGVSLREEYHQAYHRLLHRQARLYRQQGAVDRAAAVFETLLDEVPTYEDVARQLYRCYQYLGDRTQLVRQHQRLQRALRAYDNSEEGEELDPAAREPDPQTVAVYEEVLADLKRQADEAA